MSTKAAEEQRQSQQNTSADILFTPETTAISQRFLTNSRNNDRLINDLVVTCECRGLNIKQGVTDADWLIVLTAMAIAITQYTSAVFVANDTYLLVYKSSQHFPTSVII
ncbi:MAG: hypothetical protein ABW185_09310 [Sedimenticola sp.]